uniref:C2H2-type domain-containing protein n=1 Tax=Amphiprion percula TaxID=161767 RepID=A0A3P8TH93_AMPPE
MYWLSANPNVKKYPEKYLKFLINRLASWMKRSILRSGLIFFMCSIVPPDCPQQHVCKEGNGLANRQLCNQEKNFSLDQEEPEPPQITEEQEEVCTSQQGKQIVLKQVTDTFLLTSTDKDSDHSELEPNSDQLLSYNLPKKGHNRKSSNSNNTDKSSLSEIHHDTDAGRKSVKCDVCGNTFKNKYQIKKHHKIHKGIKPYACNACRKSFSLWSELKVHMIIHKGEKRYSCETCGKRFSNRGHLTVHMRTHTGEKPFSCETCGKNFRYRGDLTVHMRTHTGEKPFSCETCGKSFSNRGHLTVHMRTHTGEKPFSCETCGKSFSYRGDLTVHMRTHTGEKPFSCETCGKNFSRRGHLTVHMRTHTGEKL